MPRKEKTPFRTLLLLSNVGNHLSILLILPDGEMLEADVRPQFRLRIESIYDLVEAPEAEQTFETARVLVLEKKEVQP